MTHVNRPVTIEIKQLLPGGYRVRSYATEGGAHWVLSRQDTTRSGWRTVRQADAESVREGLAAADRERVRIERIIQQAVS